jgi:hypothetical protein
MRVCRFWRIGTLCHIISKPKQTTFDTHSFKEKRKREVVFCIKAQFSHNTTQHKKQRLTFLFCERWVLFFALFWREREIHNTHARATVNSFSLDFVGSSICPFLKIAPTCVNEPEEKREIAFSSQTKTIHHSSSKRKKSVSTRTHTHTHTPIVNLFGVQSGETNEFLFLFFSGIWPLHMLIQPWTTTRENYNNHAHTHMLMYLVCVCLAFVCV